MSMACSVRDAEYEISLGLRFGGKKAQGAARFKGRSHLAARLSDETGGRLIRFALRNRLLENRPPRGCSL